MQIANGKQDVWANYEKNNKDGYDLGILRYAKKWAELMEAEFAALPAASSFMDFLKSRAEALSHDADTEGITGFMYGAAVKTLSDVWTYGDELRRWHNKEYDYEGDGVVNPAVITISSK